ncbi:hypothetical protein BDY19DRAFT_998572 [Irpex rosettiformis]|uniref:Uncharacterized protein n=1 Tax=Irpex rosettiformis TaxID=378272 RepID=A0ACB8TN62_9APHY|nr:hypothetical protein BDY19DRAFT_998572 [Irpex rosettiformis]
MEKVFEQLLADYNLTVNGAHWACLIHAYGCDQKYLDKAIAIFESIKDHPSTKRSGAALPDAVPFESLINVFNTVRRTDLVPQYIANSTSMDVSLVSNQHRPLSHRRRAALHVVRQHSLTTTLWTPSLLADLCVGRISKPESDVELTILNSPKAYGMSIATYQFRVVSSHS